MIQGNQNAFIEHRDETRLTQRETLTDRVEEEGSSLRMLTTHQPFLDLGAFFFP